ncbi:MAG: M48 family metallopeptidase [Pseudomonadota bacterium]
MSDAFTATYFDGLVAGSTKVIARREFASLIVTDRDNRREIARWPIEDLIEYREEKNTGLFVIGPRDGDARLHVVGDGIIRDAKAALPELKGAGVPWIMVRKVGILAAGALGSVALIIFVIMPALATQLAEMIPPEREVAFGKSVQRQIDSFFGDSRASSLVCTDEEGQLALQAMTDRLMEGETLPYPLTVSVFDHPLVNAFAMPGGHIVLFRGLIEEAESPNEVAAVLAHEIGHVAERDPTRIALQSAGSAGILGLLFGDFTGGTAVLVLANQFVSAKYSQEAETQADVYAHTRMLAVGLPPDALAVMFERLRKEHGDSDGITSHFLSHPSFSDRIDAARAAGRPAGEIEPALNDEQWAALRKMCGK